MDTLMACGCSANATCKEQPCCAIHGCLDVAGELPNLEGRKARCAYGCNHNVASSLSLAFFQYRGPGSPNGERPMDTYYCGCFGWD
jgi:hypothetical protein